MIHKNFGVVDIHIHGFKNQRISVFNLCTLVAETCALWLPNSVYSYLPKIVHSYLPITAIMLATIIAGGITLTSAPFDSKAMYSGETHACVTVQTTPSNKEVYCSGVGTVCTDVQHC